MRSESVLSSCNTSSTTSPKVDKADLLRNEAQRAAVKFERYLAGLKSEFETLHREARDSD